MVEYWVGYVNPKIEAIVFNCTSFAVVIPSVVEGSVSNQAHMNEIPPRAALGRNDRKRETLN